MKIITITGASGSGKTTLADEIHKVTESSVKISLDDYYLSPEEQIKLNGCCNFDDPAALDSEMLTKNIRDLVDNNNVSVPIYCFQKRKRQGFRDINSADLIIVEGLYTSLFLRELSNVDIFVSADLDIALIRRIQRDMKERGRTLDSVVEQYINYVKPAYSLYIEKLRSHADIVVENNGTCEDLIQQIPQVMELVGE